MTMRLRLGTRGSALALWQAERVAGHLGATEPAVSVETIVVRTRAERFPEQPVEAIGQGVFTKELDDALLREEIDLAVHSAKDIPSRLVGGLVIAAFLERESPLDAFVAPSGQPFGELPGGARIGTGSPRRRAQLLARRPDVQVLPLRGNVDTRLRKLDEEGLAGTVLAHAGLRRLGREEVITELFPPETLVPAVGQGAVAVVARSGDAATRERLAALDHGPTRQGLEAERAFLEELRGGCQVPAGALAHVARAEVALRAVVASPDGTRVVRAERRGPVPRREAVGRELARELLERGGREILAAL